MNPLRTPLLVNAFFSFGSGLFLSIAPELAGGWLGIDQSWTLRVFGLVLIGHVPILFVGLSRLGEVATAKLNLLAIAPYPFLVLALVIAGVIDRPFGQGLALIDACVIGAIAVALGLGLRSQVPVSQPQRA